MTEDECKIIKNSSITWALWILSIKHMIPIMHFFFWNLLLRICETCYMSFQWCAVTSLPTSLSLHCCSRATQSCNKHGNTNDFPLCVIKRSQRLPPLQKYNYISCTKWFVPIKSYVFTMPLLCAWAGLGGKCGLKGEGGSASTSDFYCFWMTLQSCYRSRPQRLIMSVRSKMAPWR